jgi:hypothetical protein
MPAPPGFIQQRGSAPSAAGKFEPQAMRRAPKASITRGKKAAGVEAPRPASAMVRLVSFR